MEDIWYSLVSSLQTIIGHCLPSASGNNRANIWVTAAGTHDGLVYKLRATEGNRLGMYTVGLDLRGVAFDGTNIWVADNAGNLVYKLRASDALILGSYATGLVQWV